MDDFRNTTFVLSDEEGNEIEVEIIDTLEHEGKIYVAMMEAPASAPVSAPENPAPIYAICFFSNCRHLAAVTL